MTKAELLQIAKPIIFNTEMVRAILDGRKTRTRRVIKPQYAEHSDGTRTPLDKFAEGFNLGLAAFAPHQPGDYLYVRETWGIGTKLTGGIIYKADYINKKAPFPDGENWRPSIHMPKEVARIFLRVTDVRAERVQDITIDDIIKEGVQRIFGVETRLEAWIKLWDSTIKPADRVMYGWAANPWVWVYSFERVEVA